MSEMGANRKLPTLLPSFRSAPIPAVRTCVGQWVGSTLKRSAPVHGEITGAGESRHSLREAQACFACHRTNRDCRTAARNRPAGLDFILALGPERSRQMPAGRVLDPT